jgi:hypothetical protein
MEAREHTKAVIVNVFIHKEAKMSRKAFLKRVTRVRAIRTRSYGDWLTWYPRSFEDFRRFENFHSAINIADFSNFCSSADHVFGVLVAPALYAWLKQNSLSTIQRQIINYFAAKYIAYESQRATLRENLYSPCFEEVLQVVKAYYASDPESAYSLAQSESAAQNHEKLKQDYVNASSAYSGAEPPELLRDFHEKNHWMMPESESRLRKAWGVTGGRNGFDFDFDAFYFTEKDWEEIIIKGNPDELQRAEAKSDLWDKWKLTFDRYEQTKNHVFRLTSENVKKYSKLSAARSSKPVVRASVHNEVLKDHEYSCIFDGRARPKFPIDVHHVIPRRLIERLELPRSLYTDRANLVACCEPCNVAKSDKLSKEDVRFYLSQFSGDPDHPNALLCRYLRLIQGLQDGEMTENDLGEM